MKKYKIILLGIVCVGLLSSCSDWLNVNVNPNTPTAESATIETRLPHCEFFCNGAIRLGAHRASFAIGYITRMGRKTHRDVEMAKWHMNGGVRTSAYQWVFVGCGSNINDLYNKAIEQKAWHYAAAAKIIRASMFMMLTDLYGEMPYTEALGEKALPAYDTGKTIFMGCIADIDEAIELLQKDQDPTLPPLAAGDSWCNGDINKWLKLAYLFKARWLNHLTKKAPGSYKEGKYDVKEILACLDKAQTSIADNVFIDNNDNNGPSRDFLWGEAVDFSRLYSAVGMNNNIYVTQMLVDNLTNFAENGVEDPRADKLIPWAMSKKSTSSPADLKWEGNWRRSIGVDMHTLIRQHNGPYTSEFDRDKGGWFIDPKAGVERLGDTVYVHVKSGSKGTAKTKDLMWRADANNSDDGAAITSMFYVRPSSPEYIATYHEACFIRAEVLFNKGDKHGAYEAYKKGIKASIDAMNSKLNVWCGEDENYKKCPSFRPMTEEDITNFMNNGVGKLADFSLGHIMTQKRLAMLFTMELYNDMRRYDYDSNIFFNWEIPAEYYTDTEAKKYIPEGKVMRRWPQCWMEANYNAANLQAIGASVPGADMSSNAWNVKDDVWTIPVWWDSNQE